MRGANLRKREELEVVGVVQVKDNVSLSGEGLELELWWQRDMWENWRGRRKH